MAYWIILPVLLLCTFAMSTKAKKTNHNLDCKTGIMNLNGYKILWNRIERSDTINVLNPKTNQWEHEVKTGYEDPDALELNGEKVVTIYFENKYKKPQAITTDSSEFADFNNYLSAKFLKEFPQVTNTSYIGITNALIDKKGNIVYYDIITGRDPNEADYSIPDEEYKKVERMLTSLIDNYGNLKLNAEHKGKPVYIDQIAKIVLNP